MEAYILWTRTFFVLIQLSNTETNSSRVKERSRPFNIHISELDSDFVISTEKFLFQYDGRSFIV